MVHEKLLFLHESLELKFLNILEAFENFLMIIQNSIRFHKLTPS